MIVVADASPLIALARIGRLEMLRDVFGSICLPDAVWREVVEAGVNRTGADVVLHGGWIERRSVTDDTLVSVLRRDLGAGEAEAIVLAREIGAALVLMDERMGRAAAMRLGLRVTGLVGVLIEALDRTDFGSHYGSGKLFRFLGKHIVNDHIHLHVKIHAEREG